MEHKKLAYSIAEACSLTSVGRTTLYQAIKKGDLKTHKIGRRTVILAASLDIFSKSLPSSKPASNAEVTS